MKILGFMFNNKPSPKAHVDFLISKFHRHVWSLFHLKRAGLPNDTIVEVYKSMSRPILEYAGNVICTMLTEGDTERLESCRRRSLKIFYGFDLSYEDLLQKTQIPRLRDRRRMLFEKFCIKMSASDHFKMKWLPRKELENTRNVRNPKKYLEFNAGTDRLHRCPLYEMRRFLNSL